jgi:hypothetical protein
MSTVKCLDSARQDNYGFRALAVRDADVQIDRKG